MFVYKKKKNKERKNKKKGEAQRMTETTRERMSVACLRVPHIHTREDDCFPSCCSPSSNVRERFDLLTFIFLLTFLKNLATLWEVWQDGICWEFEQHIGGQ